MSGELLLSLCLDFKNKQISFVSTTEFIGAEKYLYLRLCCLSSGLHCLRYRVEAWGYKDFEVKSITASLFSVFLAIKSTQLEWQSSVNRCFTWLPIATPVGSWVWHHCKPLPMAQEGTQKTPCSLLCLIIVRNIHVVGCIFLILEASFSMCFSQSNTCIH